MTEPDPTAVRPDGPAPAEDSSSPKPHGDPLLDSAQGRGDGDDASRHGRDVEPGQAP